MEKNVVLCSDGTGNKGGSGSDTNVFKIYNAIQINDLPQDARRQVVFYDNRVGTSKLSLKKALGGGADCPNPVAGTRGPPRPRAVPA